MTTKLGRRGFIGALIGAAVFDPERLLWTPGKKLISIPNPINQSWSYTVKIIKSRLSWHDLVAMPVAIRYLESGSVWIPQVYAGAGWRATAEVVGSRPISPYSVEETIKVTVNVKEGNYAVARINQGGSFSYGGPRKRMIPEEEVVASLLREHKS